MKNERFPFLMIRASTRRPCVCNVFWSKSLSTISDKRASENAIFMRFYRRARDTLLRLGMFRVAGKHVSYLDRASFVSRLGVFRNSVRHLSQCLMRNAERQTQHETHKTLTISILHKCAENRVFAAKHSPVEKKCVDSSIDCWLISTFRVAEGRLAHGHFPNSSSMPSNKRCLNVHKLATEHA